MSSPVGRGPAVAASVAPIVVISVIAFVVPISVHLGSLLIAAPVLVAALSTARWTVAAAALSLLAAMVCDLRDGLLHSAVMPVHAAALLAVSVFLVALCRARERVRKEAGQLRAISEATQHVVLRPLPRRIANLRVASAYCAAESLARVGGDLYAAARTPYGTRLVIGDVKGKGLRALDDAAALLGAFREAAHQHAALPDLAAALERSVRRHVTEASHTDADAAERFVTALLVEFPTDEAVMRTVSCGHPLPLLLRDQRITALSGRAPAPPLGLASLDPAAYRQDTVACAPHDVFLLYTDGLAEARDDSGRFYPLTDRGTRWCTEQGDPEVLLRQVLDDLVRHTGGRLDDDVALVAVQCAPGA
ncbi:PP2C family protein-serine/threonine phosphatase [Streptomyces sp. NPDC005731]|uniref:PP2C family protein-serine/threonine phosphatase n=1 Tax=Streptomyces sp. NPDC005731 TaxID=3157056 RepID=UPI0033D7F65C